MPLDRLDHRVVEGTERGVGPVAEHHPNPAGAADPGDLAAEPQPVGQRMGIPEIARAITSRWISEVPSKIV